MPEAHKRPTDYQIRQLIAAVRRNLKRDGENINASYRRGAIDALLWVLGRNRSMDRQRKAEARRHRVKRGEES